MFSFPQNFTENFKLLSVYELHNLLRLGSFEGHIESRDLSLP